MRLSACLLLLLYSPFAGADDSSVDIGGHTKLNLTTQVYPGDSVFRDLLGRQETEYRGELRLSVDWRQRGWALDADYQLIGRYADPRTRAATSFPAFANAAAADDSRRWFDLTTELDSSGHATLVHRFDRLSLGFASEKTVLRFGRQALSWGNGLFFAPMDLVNPFDPAAIDTEYKAGDDMLYLQFLQSSGNDVQAAVVVGRNPQGGGVESDHSTVAVKYHGFASNFEYDLLIAESYSDSVLGFGISRAIGSAQWSADAVVTDTAGDTVVQLVTNLSYSWIAGGYNMSGVLEYHFNGFGQGSTSYSPAALAGNADLVERLGRGQTFTLGRHYLAGSVTIEVTPLWTIAPVLLANLQDPSALLQLTTNYSLADNMTLLASANVPVGVSGSEYGGISTGLPGRFLSADAGLFAQFAWYF